MFAFLLTAQTVRERDRESEGVRKMESAQIDTESKNQVRKWTSSLDHIVVKMFCPCSSQWTSACGFSTTSFYFYLCYKSSFCLLYLSSDYVSFSLHTRCLCVIVCVKMERKKRARGSASRKNQLREKTYRAVSKIQCSVQPKWVLGPSVVPLGWCELSNQTCVWTKTTRSRSVWRGANNLWCGSFVVWMWSNLNPPLLQKNCTFGLNQLL